MTNTIELRPETEARLAVRAAESGMSLPNYVCFLLEAYVRETEPLSPAERANLWRESSRDLPHSEPLSDEAISRELIYTERG